MEKEESGFPITADVATRMLFALTPLGDELIKAVLGDVGKFIGEKGEIQKIFGDFPRHYVSLDYYRVSDRYVVDLEMQKSYDSHIVKRAWEYLNWIFHDNLLNPEEGKKVYSHRLFGPLDVQKGYSGQGIDSRFPC